MTKAISAGLLALMMLAAAGCNTVAGAGEDVSDVGHKVTQSADDHK